MIQRRLYGITRYLVLGIEGLLVRASPPEQNIVFVKQVKYYTKMSGSSAATKLGIRFTYFYSVYTCSYPTVDSEIFA